MTNNSCNDELLIFVIVFSSIFIVWNDIQNRMKQYDKMKILIHQYLMVYNTLKSTKRKVSIAQGLNKH